MDWPHTLAGFIVGIMVGLTGVGGGSLMAPIMILLLGVAPVTAVGTDLWFAAITKIVGGAIHYTRGGEKFGPDFKVIRRLCIGSIPAAAATLWVLAHADMHQVKSGLVMQLLGCVLIATAAATLFGRRVQRIAAEASVATRVAYHRFQPLLTGIAGAVLGTLVTLTSIGAGALGATVLLAIYPRRMNPRRLVATDVVHAVPLTIVAGMGHLWIGNVDGKLLGMLLTGSIPGIVVGSVLASKVSDRVLRPALCAILIFAGCRLLV